jgi:hypothetical protein
VENIFKDDDNNFPEKVNDKAMVDIFGTAFDFDSRGVYNII